MELRGRGCDDGANPAVVDEQISWGEIAVYDGGASEATGIAGIECGLRGVEDALSRGMVSESFGVDIEAGVSVGDHAGTLDGPVRVCSRCGIALEFGEGQHLIGQVLIDSRGHSPSTNS
jgi:hypothetical protein